MKKTSQKMLLKPYGLKKQVKNDFKCLKKAYKKAVFSSGVGINEWLRDNYYLLERECLSAKKGLKKLYPMPCENDDTPRVYNLCVDALYSGLPLEEAIILGLISKQHWFEARELDLLELMLRIALIHFGCIAIIEKDESKIARSVTGIREMPSVDFENIIERFSESEHIFLKDPAGVYTKMDESTKSLYRRRCAVIAESKNMSEDDFASVILEKARAAKDERKRHIGYYLFENTKISLKLLVRGRIFIIMMLLLPAVASVAVAMFIKIPYFALLLFLPLREMIRPVFESLATRGVNPIPLCRMDYDGVIPENAKTLVAVSCLVPSPDKAKNICRHLEYLWRQNSCGHIKFCLLADLKEADTPERAEDNASINALKREVRELNIKHGNSFMLLVRRRVPINTQNAYAGYERKRGALMQLMARIKGDKVYFTAAEGDVNFLNGVKYIMALDADTELMMDSVYELVSIASHPLNKAVIDPVKKMVTEGYGIFAPKIGTDVRSASKTRFSQIMGGIGGITAYDVLSGNLYQDLFGRGIFAGKGLIDVEAFNECMTDVFPDERILSHDILEGSYLRTAYVANVEITDGCPKSADGWLKRLHRWIRGDVQNLRWIFYNVPTGKGRVKNPLSGLSRYHLFDNLLRALSPIFAMALVVAALFYKDDAFFLLSTALNAVMAAGFFSLFCIIVYGGFSMLARRYYSGIMPEAYIALSRALLSAVMLAETSVKSLDAIIRALYRMLFSKKKLLEWTTAADADANNEGTFLYSLKQCKYSILFGVVFLVFGELSIKIFGAVILLCPFVLYSVSKPKNQKAAKLTSSEADILKGYAASMWRYFEDNCNRENNYLPPDNVQFSPVHAVAKRTSPTNIGLMLLSVFCAYDMGFIDFKEMISRIKNSIDTIFKLERWQGNLLNWYDTVTLKAMKPRFCSTVDSGNLACCLIALYNGLLEFSNISTEVYNLRERIKELIDMTDITPLYDKKRKLFYIGYDIENDRLSPCYYDLLMSESRMTSYYAVASRQVKKKHWGALGRTLTSSGGYAGPVSWTGTMFEYFMPSLLMPVYENTMEYEALRYCLYCQRKRAAVRNAPWGCSESGFFAFDPHFNYQYKAHGVQRLGLKRGLNNEFVVSPYSAFLAVPHMPGTALKNLLQLEKMGLFACYGFYEAVDFTKSRRGSASYAVVRSYMSHHIGMSICAVNNALNDNILQKRFMQNEMQSAEHLLQEKIPTGSVVYNNYVEKNIPEKPGRSTGQSEEYDDIQPTAPKMHLLSNGDMTIGITDSGAGFSRCQGVNVYRTSNDIQRRPQGVFAAVQYEDKSFFVTRAPDYSNSGDFRAEFSPSYAAFYHREGLVEAGMSVSVHPGRRCEFRSLIIKNHAARKINAVIRIYLEPLLCKAEDEISHPAFTHLFLESEYDEELKIITFEKRPRGEESPVCLAIGFYENIDYDFCLSREVSLKRPYGIKSLISQKPPVQSNKVSLPDACADIYFKCNLPPKSEKSVMLILSVAGGKNEAITQLVKCRNESKIAPSKCAVSPLFDTGLESRIASFLLPCLFYRSNENGKRKNYTPNDVENGISNLWSVGISGDLPIVAADVVNDYDVERIEPYIALHSRLRKYGIRFDLCIVTEDGGDYSRPIMTAVNDIITKLAAEHLKSVRGGIYIVDRTTEGPQTISAIFTAAAVIAPKNMARILRIPDVYYPVEILPSASAEIKKDGYKVEGGIFDSESFIITKKPILPWCHILSNEYFGTMVSDSALGFTFAENARENRLTPWQNDTMSDNNGEMLVLKTEGECYDLINGTTAEFSESFAKYKGKIRNLQYEVTVFVPADISVKVIDIILKGKSEGKFDLAFYTEPVLGFNKRFTSEINGTVNDNILKIKNMFYGAYNGIMYISSDEDLRFLFDRAAFFNGQYTEGTSLPNDNPCAAAIVSAELDSKREKRIRFVMGYTENEENLKETTAKSLACTNQRIKRKNSIIINTPDVSLNILFNTWLILQTENSRINARTSFYQCSGAYGFRDQLQDCCAYMLVNPERAQKHIMLCCKRQFSDGDVLHWWHELPGGASGVRTRCSDDMLWLPFTVCEYCEKTGNNSILYEMATYLSADELDENEGERYFKPSSAEYEETVLNHCKKAIKRVKFGAHGLPLIGTCDWNDGFSRVGSEGKGESVWLGMFYIMVCEKFTKLLKSANTENEYAVELLKAAQQMRITVDEKTWDGNWYMRAFFDDGSPIGAESCSEAKIDLLPQAFSVFADMPDKERVNKALNSCLNILIDNKNQIISLFLPPFNNIDAGYISAYPEGIRENGGQYTHAAVWFVKALFEAGKVNEGYKLLNYINPVKRAQDPEIAAKTMTEPFAVAADIYNREKLQGRGGWSQYTGAAGWLYQTILYSLLGIKIENNRIYLNPALPDSWQGYEAKLYYNNTSIELSIRRGAKEELETDGKPCEYIALDGGCHNVILTIAAVE